ncbi:MAG: GrpB family protein [Boseongicola sp.]
MSLIASPDPAWQAEAEAEKSRWVAAVKKLAKTHHIGSTSIPGLPAKPVIDLLCVFDTAASQIAARPAVEAMGYEWLGEYGLVGRSYARKADPESGRHLFHAHCYAVNHPDIRRHLAFRDALRENAALRAAYTSIKAACAARHPEGGRAYGECKSRWINKAEARALELYE